jgi:hypothetical protein
MAAAKQMRQLTVIDQQLQDANSPDLKQFPESKIVFGME